MRRERTAPRQEKKYRVEKLRPVGRECMPAIFSDTVTVRAARSVVLRALELMGVICGPGTADGSQV
jgi:hypothetical protein